MTAPALSGRDAAPVAASPPPAIGVFERWLSLWVAICIVAGVALGACS